MIDIILIIIYLLFILKIYIYISNITNNNNIINNNKNNKNINNIKIITYNVNNMPYFSKNLHALKKLIKENDIIFFQEMFLNFYDKDKYREINIFCENNNYNLVTSNNLNLNSLKWIDGGLRIITKYPILKHGFKNVSCDNIDFLSNKGILWCEIEINNKKMLLFTTHLQSTYFSNIVSKCQINQIKSLFEYIEYISKKTKNNNILLGGDFNCDILNNFNRKKLLNYFKNYNKYFPKKCTFENQIIDFFITKNIELTDVNINNYDNYSDHNLVSCKLN